MQRVKIIDLAKELGVTSKDLIAVLEGMGHKGMRAMSPLLPATVGALRVKLGHPQGEVPSYTVPLYTQRSPSGARMWKCQTHEVLWGKVLTVGEDRKGEMYWNALTRETRCETCMVRTWKAERARRVSEDAETLCSKSCRRGRVTAWPFNCTCICVGWHHPHVAGSSAERLFVVLKAQGVPAPLTVRRDKAEEMVTA